MIISFSLPYSNSITLFLLHTKTYKMESENEDFADCAPAHLATIAKNIVKSFETPTIRQRTAVTRKNDNSRRAMKERALGVAKNASRRKGSTPMKNNGKLRTTDSRKAEPSETKKRHARPATLAERNVYKAQKSTKPCFRRLPLVRCIREVAQDVCLVDREGKVYTVRFTMKALDAIILESEDFLTHLMARLNKLAEHAGRCTIYPEDFRTLESLERMKTGGILERTVFRKQNADGTAGSLVLIGATPKTR